MSYDKIIDNISCGISGEIDKVYKDASGKKLTEEQVNKIKLLDEQKENVIKAEFLPRKKCLEEFAPIYSKMKGSEYKYIEVPILVPMVNSTLDYSLDQCKFVLGVYAKAEYVEKVREYITTCFNRLDVPADRYLLTKDYIHNMYLFADALASYEDFFTSVVAFPNRSDEVYLVPEVMKQFSISLKKAYVSAGFGEADIAEALGDYLYSCMYYRINNKSKDIDFDIVNKEIDHIVTKTLEYRL